jgi:sugar phosphate isomerase/epimerase
MKLKWAFASATVMNLDWPEEFKLLRRFKWKAVELWFDKMKACLEKGETCAALGRRIHDAGIEPIGLGPGVVWTTSSGRDPRFEHDELSERMDVAAALGAAALTVVTLGKRKGELEAEYRRLADKLHGVAEMAAERGLKINLEFIAGLPVNGTLGSCIELVKMVDHPALGMLLDLCHYYAGASHIEELALLPKNKLFLVHVDDAQRRPMEVLGSEHRCFPGEGRIDVPALLKEIRRRAAYKGYWSVELYDKNVWSMDPHEVFKKTSASIRKIDKALGK